MEAEYFLKRLKRLVNPRHFHFEMNAFLSTCRSVTFLLQKEMSGVPGFRAWYEQRQEALRNDSSATFFRDLRNLSQKEGRVSVVGTGQSESGKVRWSWRFAGGDDPVPRELLHRDVAECCGLHLGKLANIVLACADEFPFFTCPKQTLTPAGIRSLGITIEDVEETLGFPRGCTAVGAAANDELRLKELRSHVDGVDFRALGRLAGLDLPRRRSGLHTFAGQDTFEEVLGEYLTRQIVEGLEERRNRRRG